MWNGGMADMARSSFFSAAVTSHAPDSLIVISYEGELIRCRRLRVKAAYLDANIPAGAAGSAGEFVYVVEVELASNNHPILVFKAMLITCERSRSGRRVLLAKPFGRVPHLDEALIDILWARYHYISGAFS